MARFPKTDVYLRSSTSLFLLFDFLAYLVWRCFARPHCFSIVPLCTSRAEGAYLDEQDGQEVGREPCGISHHEQCELFLWFLPLARASSHAHRTVSMPAEQLDDGRLIIRFLLVSSGAEFVSFQIDL